MLTMPSIEGRKVVETVLLQNEINKKYLVFIADCLTTEYENLVPIQKKCPNCGFDIVYYIRTQH